AGRRFGVADLCHIALPRLGVEPRAALMAIAPALLAGGLMALALSTTDASLQGLTPMLRLLLKIALGAGFYAALLWAFNAVARRPVAS
ncbi:MAG: hypothetical protein COB49_10470, partial [Alphaproteobacteria bacterium]